MAQTGRKSTTTAVTTNTSSTITDATNSVAVSDVGHKIFCVSPQLELATLNDNLYNLSIHVCKLHILAPATGTGNQVAVASVFGLPRKKLPPCLAAETAAVAALRSNRPSSDLTLHPQEQLYVLPVVT